MNEFFYDVFVVDRLEHQRVCIGGLLTKGEALEARRILEKFNGCDVEIFKYHFTKGRVCEDDF